MTETVALAKTAGLAGCSIEDYHGEQEYELARAVERFAAAVESVDRPVSVVALRDSPPVARLAELGAARISTGGGLVYAAYAAVLAAGQELVEQGTHSYLRGV